MATKKNAFTTFNATVDTNTSTKTTALTDATATMIQ